MATAVSSTSSTSIGLNRSLRFRDLILYGIVLIQPTAPMPVFGVLYQVSHGHVVTVILLALVAMLFTSVSYGRMARAYPHGGSAFLYVGKEIHPSLGYITGWCLVMDYVINPLICTVWCSHAARNFLPGIPYFIFVLFFAALFTILNCSGVETSARINTGMAAALGVVILLVLAAAARWLLHLSHPGAGFFFQPFYDASTFNSAGLLRGTSIAVLTYIGFDGISTLTDEAKDPARSVPRAIVLTCLITGVLASIEVYVGQLVWPRGMEFPDVTTAYVHVSGRVGGPILLLVVNASLLLANMGSGMASHLGAARLLYAMGQDGALPRRFFGAVHPKSRITTKQCFAHRRDMPHRRTDLQLRSGRGTFEFRRASGLHRSESRFDSSWLEAWTLVAMGAHAALAGRHDHLLPALVEPRALGKNRRDGLGHGRHFALGDSTPRHGSSGRSGLIHGSNQAQ